MSKKYVMLPLETVDKLILQIEADLEFIHNRSIQELIDDGQMPDRYLELIAAKQNTWTLDSSEQNCKEGTSKMKFARPSGVGITEPDKTIEK